MRQRALGHLAVAVAAAGVAFNLTAGDLAWKFDSSARPADVTAASPSAEAALAVPLVVRGAGEALPCFDSRWEYALLSEGWSLYVPFGFYFIFR